MASRLIHYLVAEKIAKQHNLKDRNRFILGTLLPDLSSHEDGSYDKAHFWERIIEKDRKGINWRSFENKYYNEMLKDEIFLGYYCHLIMDALWFYLIVDRYIRIYPKEIRKSLYPKGYNDYKRLNYLLSKEYNLHYQLVIPKQIEIEELKFNLAEILAEGLKNDIICSDIATQNDLELYSYNDIHVYIDKATDICIREINAFYIGDGHVEPSIFYTTI